MVHVETSQNVESVNDEISSTLVSIELISSIDDIIAASKRFKPINQ